MGLDSAQWTYVTQIWDMTPTELSARTVVMSHSYMGHDSAYWTRVIPIWDMIYGHDSRGTACMHRGDESFIYGT